MVYFPLQRDKTIMPKIQTRYKLTLTQMSADCGRNYSTIWQWARHGVPMRRELLLELSSKYPLAFANYDPHHFAKTHYKLGSKGAVKKKGLKK